MLLLLFKPLRGHQGSLEDAISQAKQAGFDGIEGAPPSAPDQRLLFQERLQEAELAFIGEISTGGTDSPDPSVSPNQHLLDLRSGIERCLDLSPILITARTGLDSWSLDLQNDYFEKVLEMEAEYGVDITLDTLRGRSASHPWITRELLDRLPDLKLCCGFHQWCCASGRLVMNDDVRLLREIAENCWHLHACIGYADGPQAPDPRLPEFSTALTSHLKWWETVWTMQAQRGLEAVTVTPDFQPDPRCPGVDAWEVNRWMAQQLRERFDLWEASLPQR
jgi:hypothetical protein